MITDSSKLIDMFIQSLDEIRESSREKYRSMLQLWARWLILNGISWMEADKSSVTRFRQEMKDKNKSTLYANNFLNVLNKFYGFLNDEGLYPKNIAWKVNKMERYKGFRKQPLSLDQIEALLKSFDMKSRIGMRDWLVVNLMLTSGLRAVEVSRLDIGDYKEDTQSIMVLGKGKDVKVEVGISSQVSQVMKKYIGRRIHEKDQPVFRVWESCHFDDRMTPQYISSMVKTRMRKAGIDNPRISSHSLRHTFAVSLIRNEVSLFDVQALMRHTSANMTRNYTRFIEDEIRMKRKYSDQLEKYYRTKQVELGFKSNIEELYETL